MARLLGLLVPADNFRLADTLCDYRFLQRLPSKRYVLGSTSMELAQRFRETDKFVATCIAHMDALRDRTQETVVLHAFRDGLRFNTLESQSAHSIRHVMRLGMSFAVTHGAARRDHSGQERIRRRVSGSERSSSGLVRRGEHLRRRSSITSSAMGGS